VGCAWRSPWQTPARQDNRREVALFPRPSNELAARAGQRRPCADLRRQPRTQFRRVRWRNWASKADGVIDVARQDCRKTRAFPAETLRRFAALINVDTAVSVSSRITASATERVTVDYASDKAPAAPAKRWFARRPPRNRSRTRPQVGNGHFRLSRIRTASRGGRYVVQREAATIVHSTSPWRWNTVRDTIPVLIVGWQDLGRADRYRTARGCAGSCAPPAGRTGRARRSAHRESVPSNSQTAVRAD